MSSLFHAPTNIKNRIPVKYLTPLIFALTISVIGVIILSSSNAATPTTTVETEDGQVAGNASVKDDPQASGSKYVSFQASVIPPAPPPAVTNIPVPTTGAYWGIYRDPDSYLGGSSITQRQQLINEAESTLSRKFDYDRQFFKWGDNPFNVSNPQPNGYLRWSASTGGHYMLINLVSDNRSGGHTQWASIADGFQNTYLDTLAADIKTWNKPAFFTFHHEPESKICNPDGSNSTTCYGTADEYKRAWGKIVDRFKKKGVTNLSYAWLTGFYRWSTPSDYRYGPANYPGDDVIDWIGVDPFNLVVNGTSTAPDFTQWQELSTLIDPWYSWSAQHGKPLMLGAFGNREDTRANQSGHRANWFDTARSNLKTNYPKVKSLLYYDNYPVTTEPYNDWRIFTGTPESIAAYKSWGLDAYFNTRHCNVTSCNN